MSKPSIISTFEIKTHVRTFPINKKNISNWYKIFLQIGFLWLIGANVFCVADEIPEGATKIIELPNGSMYTGDIKYGVIRDGKGINEWPNGDRYKGEWLNDNPHGQGYMLRKNKEEYSGQFSFGQYDGLGDLKITTGERYLGSFRFNLLDGLGIYVSSNKEYYLGEFSQHKRHGRFLYFESISSKPEYQIWFNDALEKVIEISETQDTRDIQEKQLINQMIESFTIIAEKRLKQRRSNTHYRMRGKVRKIVSDVDNSPEHAYGDIIINLLNLSH